MSVNDDLNVPDSSHVLSVCFISFIGENINVPQITSAVFVLHMKISRKSQHLSAMHVTWKKSSVLMVKCCNDFKTRKKGEKAKPIHILFAEGNACKTPDL